MIPNRKSSGTKAWFNIALNNRHRGKKRKEVRLIGGNALLLVLSSLPGLGMKDTLAMRQLSGLYPVASDALYIFQIGVTAYCTSFCTRAGRTVVSLTLWKLNRKLGTRN